MESFTLALLFTLLAGLSTGIGGFITLGGKGKKFLPAALGFSAGVMIYVSFLDIMPQALDSLRLDHGEDWAQILLALGFFIGILLIGLLDFLVPGEINPHEYVDEGVEEVRTSHQLLRIGRFSALAITFHNFPEGIATFIATAANPAMGISIAVAVAIHNIPEGISVAAPIYHATGDRKKALKWAFGSGLSEPLGGLMGYLFLRPFLNPTVFGMVFSLVAGIMVYISLDELLPTAEKYGDHHIAMFGLIAGMVVMAASMILL
ncbi:MAG: zinc transporter ZupT [Tissierellia bacterium]|nr:zinc transporter ZupT [Tissierellia bacterium]